MDLHGVWRHFTFHNIHMDTDMAPCLHIITVTYFRYENRPIQNRYNIIYHNSRILNIKSWCNTGLMVITVPQVYWVRPDIWLGLG